MEVSRCSFVWEGYPTAWEAILSRDGDLSQVNQHFVEGYSSGMNLVILT